MICLKRLKTILKYNIIFLLSIIFSLIVVNTYNFKSKYIGKKKEITGFVKEYKKSDKLILTIKAKEKVMVYYDKDIIINYNDYILVKGNLEKPKENTNFNMFNYKKYLNSKRINYIMYADSIKIKTRNKNIFYKVKNRIQNRIDKCKSKDYLNVFIMGNKNNIDKDTKNIYKNLGIIHLLSISGTYISLIILFLKKIKLKNKIIIPLLLIYIAFTNFQISIIRSVMCYILFVINKKFKLGFNSKEIVVLFASFLLVINPFYINDIGFLLSFIISYSLIYFNYLYVDKNYFFKLLIVSTISFFVSLPIIINTNYSINFLSIFYNIIYVPFVSFVIFPLSIITFIFPTFDNLLLFLISIFEKLSIFLNSINVLTLSFSKIPIILIIIYYLLLFNKKNYFLLIILIFYFYNYYIFIPRLYFIDVGQGDSALIRYKDKNILIDTGGNYKYDYSDSYISMFKSFGVKRIDYMFISHGDVDHIGNSIEYIKKIKIDNIYINKYKKTKLEKELCKYKCKKLGDEDIIKINDINFYILNPNYDMFDENDNSLVINFSIKNKNVLFMGDSSKKVEDRIINDYDIGKVDILKIGHHGSNTSSSYKFINEINPSYSVISVGKNNRYGHPNKEVLENLNNSKIYRTDLDGSIMFKIKNNKFKIETCCP